ncbi:transposase, partial [Streptomyces sp. NPDC087769]|uniref:transposase n=1 Tax=Streptomyces sp. NPDC087769 TaxID=3365802 RepID=UPI0037F91855
MHVLSDANGLPLVVGVSAANTHDSQGLKPMVAGLETRHDPHRDWHYRPGKLHADKAYGIPDLRKWLRGKTYRRPHSPQRNRIQRTARTPQMGHRTHYVRHEALCLYPGLSREGFGRRFLGRMTYLDPKGEGDNSMSENQ